MGKMHGGRTKDMTSGPIIRQLLLFALPLMAGNAFQMLYNTVDVYVVGNYVSKQALAAVGSTSMIINLLVFFFNGFSLGAGVIIGQRFGAHDHERLHSAIETTMAATFVLCGLLTLIGVAFVRPMLRFMATPEDVFEDATVYLTIYFAGISGLLIYNMGSGILRAVGNTALPLMFLAITSVLNIALDLLFVLVFRMGIAGVAYATILSQFISAVLTLMLLTRTREIYRMTWHDLRIEGAMLKKIVALALPTAIQSTITAFSNIFVQSYVNFFQSSAMAGWSCYNKLNQFIMLPVQSMAHATTTFVSQNVGARQIERAEDGTRRSVLISVAITATIAMCLFIIAEPAVSIFSKDRDVIGFGARFLRYNVFFLIFNCVTHTLAGALRGRNDSTGPMMVMMIGFVGIRQLYLFITTRYISNTATLVGLGYPVGWVITCVMEVTYYEIRKRTKTGAYAPLPK